MAVTATSLIMPIIKYTPMALRVCQQYWYGRNLDEIARMFDIPKSRVQALLALPETQSIMEELTNHTLDTMLQVATSAQAAAPACMEEKVKLALEDPDSRVRTMNCKDILEMAGHSPVKRIQLNRPDANTEKHANMDEHELREAVKKKVGIVNPGDLDPGRVLN